MIVRCLHTLAEIAPLREQINELNLAAATPDPFSTFEFYAALLASDELSRTSTPHRVWFLAAFDADRLAGYLALKQTAHSVWRQTVVVLGFLVEHDGDRPHVVAKAADIAAVTQAFYACLHRRREWDLLELQQQDEQSTLYPLPTGVRLSGCWVKEWPNMENYTLTIRWGSLEGYLQALSKKFRSEVKRGMRKLFAAGNLELLTSSDPRSTPALLELYFDIERHSWKSQANLSLSGETTRAARIGALLDSRQPMRIVIQIVLLDGVPVAGLICGAFSTPTHEALYALHVVYDDRYSALAPGTAVLLFGIRYAIERQYAFFNWLSGFGHYKTRWLAQSTATRSAQIYRVGRIPFWRRLLGDARRYFLKRLPGRDATGDVAQPLFNPMRRELLQDDRVVDRVVATATAMERERCRRLLAVAKAGQCEHLSSSDLATALPFCEAPSTAARDAHSTQFGGQRRAIERDDLHVA